MVESCNLAPLPLSEGVAGHHLKHWPGPFGFKLVFVEVAVDLILDGGELVEVFVLGPVQQVRTHRTDREAVPKAILYENFKISAVAGENFLADDPAKSFALIAIGRPEGRARSRRFWIAPKL